MSWTTLRDGIQAAVVAATQLPADKVVWKDQDVGQPALPYAAVQVSASDNPGQDGIVPSTDLTRPAGKEVELKVVGLREITIAVEVYVSMKDDAGSAIIGEGDALDVADRAATSLLLPSVRDLLTAVAVSPLEVGPVQYVPTLVSAGFRGRATFEVRANAPAQDVSDFVGYIASCSGTLTYRSGEDPTERTFEVP